MPSIAGGVIAAGPVREVLTEANLEAAFGLPLRLAEVDGRFLIFARA